MRDMMTLQQTLAWLTSARLVGHGAVTFRRVHTDTRTIEAGDLFVALQGERFDANDFLAEAKAKGAVAAICQGDADERLRAVGLDDRGEIALDRRADLVRVRVVEDSPLVRSVWREGERVV